MWKSLNYKFKTLVDYIMVPKNEKSIKNFGTMKNFRIHIGLRAYLHSFSNFYTEAIHKKSQNNQSNCENKGNRQPSFVSTYFT